MFHAVLPQELQAQPSLQELKCLFSIIFANYLIREYKSSHFSTSIVSFCYTAGLVLDKICLNYARSDNIILPFREKVVPLQAS